MFSKHIFKAYDIRGLVQGELSEELAYRLGRAFIVFLREKGQDLSNKKVVIGRDMRLTSPVFSEAVIRGFLAEGVDCVDIGLCSTPLFNFTCAHFADHLGGIMVTASHNPAEYNGFKLTLGDGLPIGLVTGMERIKQLVLENNFDSQIKNAQKTEFDPYPDYESKIFSLVEIEKLKNKKIVIDFGNGMGLVTFDKLLKKLPVTATYLYPEPDGNFPNHEANPLKTDTLVDLQKKVLEEKADFGFALDGDADRIGLVDELGQVVPASFVGGLIGLEVLQKHSGELMYYDLRCSRAVKEVWEENGAKTDICQVGHANIKKMMKDNQAKFASELSLHLYFHDTYDLECPELSFLYILKILSKQEKTLSQLWQPLNRYFHSGEINFAVEDKEMIMKKIAEKYADAEINKLDGLLFTYPDYWFSIRTSNTEPVLRLNLEARSKEKMVEKVAEIKDIIK